MTFMRTVLTLCKWGKIAWYFMVPGCIDTIGMILSDWCHISAGRVKNLSDLAVIYSTIQHHYLSKELLDIINKQLGPAARGRK